MRSRHGSPKVLEIEVTSGEKLRERVIIPKVSPLGRASDRCGTVVEERGEVAGKSGRFPNWRTVRGLDAESIVKTIRRETGTNQMKSMK